MSLLAAIRKLWHSIAPRTHSDVEEEFRATLDAYQEDLIRQGLTEEEARRKARIDLGFGLAFDSFLGAVLAHWMQSAFAAGSLFAAAALLALTALLACLLPARHAIAVPPAEALRSE
jgi:hypothetical protein